MQHAAAFGMQHATCWPIAIALLADAPAVAYVGQRRTKRELTQAAFWFYSDILLK
jgi:hypothetical protein